jgi:enoyl-CoA hydratase/carnithine racemase
MCGESAKYAHFFGDRMSDFLIDTSEGVTTLSLNRADKKNSLTTALYADLATAISAVSADESVRVLVIQGHETVFSAGNDINDFLNNPPATPDAPVFAFLDAIRDFPKPLIAAVCGPAVGIGTTMLLHCDFIYAGDNALFALPFVNLGLCPEAGSSMLLPARIGHVRAAQVLLMADPFNAETALEWGLINAVLPPTEVTAYARQQALKLAAKPRESLVQTKRLMKRSYMAQLPGHMDEEAITFGPMLTQPAAREAFAAFIEKRKPDFSKL